MIAWKSQKIPNHTNTWGENSYNNGEKWEKATIKETQSKDYASHNCLALSCPPGYEREPHCSPSFAEKRIRWLEEFLTSVQWS